MTFAQSEAREMRRRIGRVTGIMLSLLAWAAFWAVMVEQRVSPLWAVACAVAAGGSLWLWHRAERYPEGVLIVEGLSLTLLAAAVYRGEPLAGLLFLAPLTLAAILLPLRFAAGLALVALGYLHFAYPDVGASYWLTPAELTGALVLLILPALAIMWESLYRSWQYSARTLELAEEARQNRGETVRLNRALNLTQSLLERHYQQLAIAAQHHSRVPGDRAALPRGVRRCALDAEAAQRSRGDPAQRPLPIGPRRRHPGPGPHRGAQDAVAPRAD
jgi:hypothetical protein